MLATSRSRNTGRELDCSVLAINPVVFRQTSYKPSPLGLDLTGRISTTWGILLLLPNPTLRSGFSAESHQRSEKANQEEYNGEIEASHSGFCSTRLILALIPVVFKS